MLLAVLLLGWILLFASLAGLPLLLNVTSPAVCRVAVEAEGRGDGRGHSAAPRPR